MNTTFILRLVLFCGVLSTSVTGSAQSDSCWTVLLLKMGETPEVRENMSSISRKGFYLYRNCVYEIQLRDERYINGRLADIKPDSLSFTMFFNSNIADRVKHRNDTFTVHYSELKTLKVIADRAMGWYENYSLDNYDFIFGRDTLHCYLPSHWLQIFTNDSSRYEIVPHLTAQGITYLYELNGRTFYYFGGGMPKPDRSKMDTTYNKRYVFGFTPTKFEEINGIAFGLHAKNIKNYEFNERDTLIVRGLNLEINPWEFIQLLTPYVTGPYPDSINIYLSFMKHNWQTKVNGINITLINTINEMDIRGLSITGAITVVDEIHGVAISGINNFSYIMNGFTVAAVRNRATRARGVQVGLLN